MKYRSLLVSLYVLMLTGCQVDEAGSAFWSKTPREKSTYAEQGKASFYSDSLHGSKTASGQLYDKGKLTAAHRTLPFGTKVLVSCRRSGRTVVVTINDRGPHSKDRVIDLSQAAAQQLGAIERGIIPVEIRTL
jgi:rare lipoprotein A